MEKLTKIEMKRNARIMSWLSGLSYKETARSVPVALNLDVETVLAEYTPEGAGFKAAYYTPLDMGEAFLRNTKISSTSSVLEPCAGIGHLVYTMTRTVSPARITAYELDEMAARIGKKLFPLVNWINGDPFSDLGINPDGTVWGADLITGMFDFAVMNPPLNAKWGTIIGDYMTQGKCTKSEHLFLELAVRAVKPGGVVYALAPFSYLDKMPKKLRSWFDRYTVGYAEMGEMPGTFTGTSITVHGWSIYRNTVPMEPREIVLQAPEKASKTPEPASQYKDARTTSEPPQTVSQPDLFALVNMDGTEWTYEGTEKLVYIEARLSSACIFPLPPSKELVNSIKRLGVLNPLLIEKDKDGQFMIRAGKRRFLAAKELGLEEIPVRIFVSNGGYASMVGLDSNRHRSANPLDDYNNLLELEKRADEAEIIYTDAQLCTLLGINIQALRKLRAASLLSGPVQDAIKEKRISLQDAAQVAKLPPSRQSKMVKRLQDGENIKTSDIREQKLVVRNVVLENLIGQIEPVIKRPDVPTMEVLELALSRQFPDIPQSNKPALARFILNMIIDPTSTLNEALK